MLIVKICCMSVQLSPSCLPSLCNSQQTQHPGWLVTAASTATVQQLRQVFCTGRTGNYSLQLVSQLYPNSRPYVSVEDVGVGSAVTPSQIRCMRVKAPNMYCRSCCNSDSCATRACRSADIDSNRLLEAMICSDKFWLVAVSVPRVCCCTEAIVGKWHWGAVSIHCTAQSSGRSQKAFYERAPAAGPCVH